jgi:ABC-type amino acid transport system permease subunit
MSAFHAWLSYDLLPLLGQLTGDFLPQLLAGMVVNFEIAAIALALGLLLGLPLALGARAAARPAASRRRWSA